MSRPLSAFVSGACGLVLTSAAAAQSTAPAFRFPSMEEIQRAAQPEVRKGPQQPGAAATSPLPASPARAAQPASGAGTRAADSTGQTRTDPASARLMALLRQHGVDEPFPQETVRGSLYVAVSFSMPKETLRRLIHQTTAAGGSVVVKGFDGAPVRTRDTILSIVGEPVPREPGRAQPPGAPELAVPASLEHMSIRVAPKMFDRFDIREVPAFVLVSPAGSHDDCNGPDCAAYRDFVSVQGDVSVPYAMEAISRLKPAYRAPAEYFGRRAFQAPTKEKR